MSKQNIYLAQVNDVFGKQKYAQLPLAVAMLWAYAKKDPIINANYRLADILYGKYPIHQLLNNMDNPNILGLSCYMWNWEFNKALAKVIKEKYPDCLIIIGGPHVPEHDTLFFKNHPYIDILVHREGELTFHEILTRHQKSENYKGILGTSINDKGFCVFQGERERIKDLMVLPSPYLEGVYDQLIANETDVIFSGTMEHTRGCPYQCSFCNIGQDYYRKIRKFTLERTFAEIDWMSNHKIDYISGADSNFGILPTDLDIAKYLVKKKQETGYPRKWRSDWAKNKTSSVLDIVKVLEDNEMNKGITVAIQSMDRNVLDIIKRSNISELEQAELLNTYEKENIKTYSELILGLPGETYNGFIKGFGTLIEAGQHNCISIYPCMVLPNSEYADPKFQKEFGIKTWISPQANYFIPDATKGEIVDEYEECIYETNTMSHQEWRKAYLFSIVGSWGHFLGFTHLFARFIRKHNNLQYHTFYEDLINWGIGNPNTILGKEIHEVFTCIDNACENNGYRGRSADSIFWDFDQSIGINTIQHKDVMFDELKIFMSRYITDEDVLAELLDIQKSFVIDHKTHYPIDREYNYNFTDYTNHKHTTLRKEKINLRFDARQPHYDNDLSLYAKDVFWFYRRTGGCKAFLHKLHISSDNDILQELYPIV